ncbi:MAG TPA: creatininase family protein [Candidatus Eisenbacteria bacterium]|nr:creatininase family protein [Candidatus Eisenbacteria bacterium]
MTTDAWRRGHALLAARVAEIPRAIARTAARTVPGLALGTREVRRVVATGVGSSAAHAALLAHVLRAAGRDATTEPLSTFVDPSRSRPDDVLVVFSQGLSPNAQVALAAPARWRRVVLVTAVTDRERLAPFTQRSVVVHGIDGEDEMGTLVRVIGPMAGYVGALQVACALGGPDVPDLAPVQRALGSLAVPAMSAEQLAAPLAFVTSGSYGELAANLQYKVLEGMLRPMPAVWDALQIAHGPFQQAFDGRATFLALSRADAAGEDALLARLAVMLDPVRHTLVRLHASLPGVLALFEHEAMMNVLMLRDIAARGVDQIAWPGRGMEGAIYDLAQPIGERRIARVTWPDVDAPRPRLAIVPLGATEQHGPHLPLATDTLIADALAARLAACAGDAIALPALAIGCSIEHMSFPGTLDLAPATLAAVLADTLRSLARHEIREAFVFSAHGGNAATLRELAPALRAAAPGLRVHVFADLDLVTRSLQREAAGFGVTPEAAGHHAGEIETSIMLALHPELVRTDALAPGYTERTTDPQAIFYPDLRRAAPSGTVGDPRTATAARGGRYLAAWLDVLAAALGDAKKSQ